jgi:hypothetical protein
MTQQMIVTPLRFLQLAALLLVVTLASGCASSRNITMTIHSEPAGAYIVMQTRDAEQKAGEWIYLGNTPLNTIREVSKKEIKNAQAIVLRAMKEGYFDQSKVWKGEAFLDEHEQKGRIFWNPVMVPARQ